MTQKNIDFGSFPDDPSAESIREAFQKIEENFTELYNTTLSTGVYEVKPGSGLRTELGRITGNVTVYANVSNVTIKTSSSLVVKPETSGVYSNTATVYDTTPFVLGLANTITTSNAVFVNSTVSGNLAISGKVTTSLLPISNETLDLGSSSLKWKDLYLSGKTLTLGEQTISSDSSGVIVSTGIVTGNLDVGTISADYVSGQVVDPEQPNITKVGILQGLEVSGDITSGNISLTGNLQTLAINAQTMNVSGAFSAGTITGTLILPPGATIDAPGGEDANMQIVFNDNGKQAAVPGLQFNKTSALLTIQGNVEGGNLITSGALDVSLAANVGSLNSEGDVNATGTVYGGNIISLGILTATDTITAGNLTTAGYLEVTGTASLGAITTTTIDGTVVSVSGNVSGANLVASGLLQVDGAASVGSLTTSGEVSAATLRATADAIIDGNVNSTDGSFVTVNGSLSGASLYSSGLADITGDFFGRANVTADGILTVVGNSSLGNVVASGVVGMANGAKVANTLTIGSSLAITATEGTGTVATLTFNLQSFPPFAVGQIITVQGLTPTTYNTTSSGVTVLSCTNEEVTYSSSATGSMITSGTVTSSGTGLSVTGNISGTNLNIAGILRAGDTEFANVNTVGLMTVSQTVTAGNLSTSGTLTSGNAVISNITNVGLISATGNITAGNISTAGLIKTTGTANVGSLVVVADAGVSGNATISGTVTGALFSGSGASLSDLNSIAIGTVVSITATAGNGTTATLTFSNAGYIPFYIGQSITVSGLSPAGYNGTFTVTAATSTTVSYTNATTGSMSVSGTVRGGSRTLSSQNADNATTAGIVTTAAQTNITSLGTLTGLTLNGALSGTSISASGFMLSSVNAGISATGTDINSAYGLTKQINVVTSATWGTADGVRLPATTLGMTVIIINTTASNMKVYPPSGSAINSLTTNVYHQLGAGARLMFVATSTSQWYSLTGVYA